MNKEQIIQAVTPAVEQRGCFLVEVSVSAENDIEIVIEKEEGVVDWEDCAAIDQVMHATFNQDEEDYALTVSSAGLDRPFKVLKQYLTTPPWRPWKGKRKRRRWNTRTPSPSRKSIPSNLTLSSRIPEDYRYSLRAWQKKLVAVLVILRIFCTFALVNEIEDGGPLSFFIRFTRLRPGMTIVNYK